MLMLLAAAVAPAGCNATDDIAEIDPSIAILEKVETVSEARLPRWAVVPGDYENAEPDTEYFLGVSFPRQTLAFARHSAAEDAYAKVAKFIGQAVAVKWQRAGEARNLHGQQSVETVVEEFVQKTIAVARVKRARLVEAHVQQVVGYYGGTGVRMYRIYELYGVAKGDLVRTGRDAAAEVADEIQREREEIRREQLKKLEEVLKDLSAEDFRL